MMDWDEWAVSIQDEVAGKLQRLGWERSGNCWRNYPFMLTIHKPKNTQFVTLWHLERIDEHPGKAWFSMETIDWLFTIVDAEVAAW